MTILSKNSTWPVGLFLVLVVFGLLTLEKSWDADDGGGSAVLYTMARKKFNTTISTFSTNHSNGDDNRPFLVIHLGPQKTATTTLQSGLAKMREQRPSPLDKDDYVYGGKNKGRSFVPFNAIIENLCYRQAKVRFAQSSGKKHGMDVECWRSLLNSSDIYRQFDFANIIMSQEGWVRMVANDTGVWPQDFFEMLGRLFPNHQMLVVVTYRRYFEFLPSVLQQHERGLSEKGWHGGSPTPLFPDYALDHQMNKDGRRHHAVEVIQQFKPFAPSLKIMNFHDVPKAANTSILTHFLCNVVPNAPNSCLASQQWDQQNDKIFDNAYQSPFYDMLATAAAEKGMFDTRRFKRHIVNTYIQKYQEKLNLTNMDFDLACPSRAELQLFLNESLSRERFVLGEAAAAKNEKVHIQDFWAAHEKHKFCSIDTDAVLKTDTWKKFFYRLHQGVWRQQFLNSGG